MYGFDFSISKDARWLTKLIDKLPLLETKEPSTISAQAEVALLQPGYNKAINQGEDTGGVGLSRRLRGQYRQSAAYYPV
jgi:cell surface protein SprA